MSGDGAGNVSDRETSDREALVAMLKLNPECCVVQFYCTKCGKQVIRWWRAGDLRSNWPRWTEDSKCTKCTIDSRRRV